MAGPAAALLAAGIAVTVTGEVVLVGPAARGPARPVAVVAVQVVVGVRAAAPGTARGPAVVTAAAIVPAAVVEARVPPVPAERGAGAPAARRARRAAAIGVGRPRAGRVGVGASRAGASALVVLACAGGAAAPPGGPVRPVAVNATARVLEPPDTAVLAVNPEAAAADRAAKAVDGRVAAGAARVAPTDHAPVRRTATGAQGGGRRLHPVAIRTAVVGVAFRGRLGAQRPGAVSAVAPCPVAAPAAPEAAPEPGALTAPSFVATAAAGHKVVGDLPGALSGRRPVLGAADRSPGQVPPGVAATRPVAVLARPTATIAVQDRDPAF